MAAAMERKNKQVWEAIEHDNLKLALQLCSKRAKRGEKEDYFLALRMYVLIKAATPTQRAAAVAELRSFIRKDPPVVDLDCLNLLQRSLDLAANPHGSVADQQQGREDVTSLWERAVKARPGDESIPRDWFFSAFHRQDWRSAQKVATLIPMTLQKSFPKTREYYFWAILCCHLIETSEETQGPEKALFGTLAFRMVSKAAAEVPTDPDASNRPERSLQTPQELHLLISIYRRQGKLAEARQILESSNLGIGSSVSKGDWSFVRAKLDLLEQDANWPEAYSLCHSLLEEALPVIEDESEGKVSTAAQSAYGDDWRIWKGLLTACQHENKETVWEATKSLIHRWIESSAGALARNPRLALLDWLGLDMAAQGRTESAMRALTEACTEYFHDSASRTCCFDDLSPHFEQLDASGKLKFLDQAASSVTRTDLKEQTTLDNITRQVNLAKMRYLRISGQAGTKLQQQLPSFIEGCLDIAKQSRSTAKDTTSTDPDPSDDAYLLAVMGAIHLRRILDEAHAGQRLTHLLQAAVLLDHLLSHSRHNYQALLMLVRIYRLLGAGSLAASTYPRLAVKQIQHDTISHNLYTRISTNHPHAIRPSPDFSLEEADLNPSRGLTRALTIYDSTAHQLPGLVKKALDESSYDQVPGFLEFGRRVKRSICQTMWQVERLRIARLLRTESDTFNGTGRKQNPLEIPSSAMADNRDEAVMISCEAVDQNRFETVIRPGPRPDRSWATAFVLVEQLSTELLGRKEDGTVSAAFDGRTQAKSLRAATGESDSAFTASEQRYLESAAIIAESVGILAEKSSTAAAMADCVSTVRSRLSTIMERNTEDPLGRFQGLSLNQDAGIPDWQYLHDRYLRLDLLILTEAFLNLAQVKAKEKKAAVLKESVLEIRSLLMQIHEETRKEATAMKNGLSESGVISRLVDEILQRREDRQEPVGARLQELLGEAHTETFASRIVESWSEALDGILRVKIY